MSWIDVENKLSRIERISRSGKKVENLAYLLNKDMLRQCYKELKPDKAAGIDKVTKKQYGMNLDQNLTRLVSKLKGGTYFPRPSRRIYIPKPGTNKKRPLGISCFEDKIVERALNKILVAVYEPRFLDCSYGFRPKRNCHQAISKVLKSINGLTSYVVEADIRNCFGSFNHDILIEALELSIADRRFIEIIRRGLKAGHLEDNIYIDDLTGTAQGSGCSQALRICICIMYLTSGSRLRSLHGTIGAESSEDRQHWSAMLTISLRPFGTKMMHGASTGN